MAFSTDVMFLVLLLSKAFSSLLIECCWREKFLGPRKIILDRFDFTFIPHHAGGAETFLAIVLPKAWIKLAEMDCPIDVKGMACAAAFTNRVFPKGTEICEVE